MIGLALVLRSSKMGPLLMHGALPCSKGVELNTCREILNTQPCPGIAPIVLGDTKRSPLVAPQEIPREHPLLSLSF